jgi:hypothetical protein
MAIGIDLTGDALRFAIGEVQDPKTGFIGGIQGILPRKNEAIVWNNPKALRQSINCNRISLGSLWNEFLSDPDSRFHWKTETGTLQEAPVVKGIADAIVQNIPKCRTSKTIIAISNLLSEVAQDRLINAMKTAGIANIELLWRPIAITLSHLSSNQDHYEEGDRIVVIDGESISIEVTEFELRQRESVIIPKRKLPSKLERSHKSNTNITSYRIAIGQKIANGDNRLFDQLFTGPFSCEFIAFTEGLPHSEFWYYTERDQFKYIDLSETYIQESSKTEYAKLLSDLSESISMINEDDQLVMLWHGMPFRIDPNTPILNEAIILTDQAVALGAMLYGDKLGKGQSTYLDMLPGLEVHSKSTKTNTFNFYELIPEGEIPGGSISRLDEPLTGFNLKDGLKDFNIILRTTYNEECKKLTTKLPNSKRGGDVPLLIRAEMRPAQGHALVTIEGSAGHEDVFGDIRRVKLDWDTMEKHEFDDVYSGPEVYPVNGRIIDDPECLNLVKYVVENKLAMNSGVAFKSHRVSFNKVFEPWGYKWPWGDNLREPTRGLFGTIQSENSDFQKLAHSLADIINQEGRNNRYKHLNQLFRFTPDWFLNDLRNAYSADEPQIDNWNMAFAPGRVFYEVKDFELFLDSIIRMSKHCGYPAHPDESYVAKYYWSFFRALCYYEETAYVDSKKIERVLNTLHRYINSRARENWAPRTGETGIWAQGNVENVKKFCLCAILFSLRHRKKNKKFLKPNSEAWEVVSDDILNKIGRVNYPVTMFATQQPDFLNDYVYRFLSCEASKQDFSALEGLTTSMS